MEDEDHEYALASSDISRFLRVFLVDDQRSLHVGNAPVSGELFGVRTDEADRLNSILIPKPLLCAPALACCHFEVQH